MADKQISDLTSASGLTDGSLFVLEQGGAAMKANWGMMKNYISPSVAAQYSSSSTYNVGDYVIYNGQLYRCTTAITTAETWTAAHWTAVVLGDDVYEINKSIEKYNKFPFDQTATIFNFEYNDTNAQKIASCILDVKMYDALDTWSYSLESTYLNGTLNGSPYTQIAIKGIRKSDQYTIRAFLYTDNSNSHSGVETFTLEPVQAFTGYVDVTVDFGRLTTGINAIPTVQQGLLSELCHVRKPKHRILVLGDSWSDTDPSHTTLTKWPDLLKNRDGYDVINYAQNGSLISGDTANFGLDGNVLGQINQMISDKVYNIDTVIIFGGINDFRGTVSAPYVYYKLLEFYNTLKARFPSARIIYVSNHQLYITEQQINYFAEIHKYIRQASGMETFSTFGWVAPYNFISDMIHPNDNGNKAIYSNMLSILNGGNIVTYDNKLVKNIVYGSTAQLVLTMTERWANGHPHYSFHVVFYNASLGNTYTIDLSASDGDNLLSSVPFCKMLSRQTADTTAKIYSDVAETFLSSGHYMNGSNTLTIVAPSANSGAYYGETYN